MNIRRYHVPVQSMLVALAALALLITGARQGHRQQPAHGRFTAQQILERALPLCRAVAPEAGDLNLTVSRGPADAAISYYWSVVGTDGHGADIVNFSWDVDTGELCTMGHAIAADRRKCLQPPLGRAEAVAASRHWLCVLGIGGNAPRLRFARECAGTSHWSISWQTEDHVALTMLNSYTGALETAQSFSSALRPR